MVERKKTGLLKARKAVRLRVAVHGEDANNLFAAYLGQAVTCLLVLHSARVSYRIVVITLSLLQNIIIYWALPHVQIREDVRVQMYM